MPEVHITSYFSIETDLAEEMRSWSEFRSGAGYSVELVSRGTGETVSISLVDRGDDSDPCIRVVAPKRGPLFDRALGLATHSLAANSDYLLIHRIA